MIQTHPHVFFLTALVSLGGLASSGLFAQATKATSIVFVSTPRGLFPSKITVPAGPVSMTFSSKTGHASVNFQLSQVTNGRIQGNFKIDSQNQKSQRSTSLITLTAGDYDLTIPGRPDVSCRITVKP